MNLILGRTGLHCYNPQRRYGSDGARELLGWSWMREPGDSWCISFGCWLVAFAVSWVRDATPARVRLRRWLRCSPRHARRFLVVWRLAIKEAFTGEPFDVSLLIIMAVWFGFLIWLALH